MSLLEKMPEYQRSTAVTGMSFVGEEHVVGTGDMWPMTWADDDAIYACGTDNSGFEGRLQTMNFWRIDGTPPDHEIYLVNNLKFLEGTGWDPVIHITPIKPAGVVSVDGVLYMAVEDMRYTQGRFGNQINLQSWIIHSKDHGKTWSGMPSPGSEERKFLTGVFGSPHFLQFGRDYSDAVDDWVYAYSSAGDDGVAAWSANDSTYLARVPRHRMLDRSAWEFYAGAHGDRDGWSREIGAAQPVFSYLRKTGENEIVYHPGLRRYLLLNWAFIDCTNHLIGSLHSELSVFESANPWGPWSTVTVHRNWGHNCDYQPRLPTKWIDPKSGDAWLVSAGNFLKKGGRGHYAFVTTPVRFNTGDFGDLDRRSQTDCVLGDFRVEPLSDTEIKLSWLPVQGVGFYRVTRDDQKLRDIAPQYPAQFFDTGLTHEETHEYKVQAMSPAGDAMAHSVSVKCATLPAPSRQALGVNLGSHGFTDGTTVWFGRDSVTRFEVKAAEPYLDDRIGRLTLRPDPGHLEPALRNICGEINLDNSIGGNLGDRIGCVKVVFRDLQNRRIRIRLYALDTRLCRTLSSFEVWIQGALVGNFKSPVSSTANWFELGPYETDVGEDGKLVVEGRCFTGLGGIAAIKLEMNE